MYIVYDTMRFLRGKYFFFVSSLARAFVCCPFFVFLFTHPSSELIFLPWAPATANQVRQKKYEYEYFFKAKQYQKACWRKQTENRRKFSWIFKDYYYCQLKKKTVLIRTFTECPIWFFTKFYIKWEVCIATFASCDWLRILRCRYSRDS